MALDQANVDDYYYNDGEPPKQLGEAKEMSFLDHLEELRWHIIRSLIAIVAVGIGMFIAKDFVFGTLIAGPKQPDFLSYRVICSLSNLVGLGNSMCITPVDFPLTTVNFGEEFITHIKVSFIMGFIIAFPYLFWEFWRFISPGLYAKERRAARGVVWVCSLLFMMGVSFGYFIIAPFAVNFLAGYSITGVQTTPTLVSYVNYMVMFTAPAGIVFELPIVVYFLSKVGLITPQFLKKYRRHAIIIILLLSALITPPDVVTQFLIGIPLFILYEISINISKRVVKREEAKEREREAELARTGN